MWAASRTSGRSGRSKDEKVAATAVAIVLHVEKFPALALAARRRHMSQAKFLELLTSLETKVRRPLFLVGAELKLTSDAVELLIAYSSPSGRG